MSDRDYLLDPFAENPEKSLEVVPWTPEELTISELKSRIRILERENTKLRKESSNLRWEVDTRREEAYHQRNRDSW